MAVDAALRACIARRERELPDVVEQGGWFDGSGTPRSVLIAAAAACRVLKDRELGNAEGSAMSEGARKEATVHKPGRGPVPLEDVEVGGCVGGIGGGGGSAGG